MAKPIYKGYVKLENELLESPAWQSLKPIDKALFVEMMHRCRPSFNGYFGFGVRDGASALHCKPDTVSNSMGRLQERMLIELMRESNWQANKAREWRLTTMPYQSVPATNDWKQWKPDK